jgi:hypothetical protein
MLLPLLHAAASSLRMHQLQASCGCGCDRGREAGREGSRRSTHTHTGHRRGRIRRNTNAAAPRRAIMSTPKDPPRTPACKQRLRASFNSNMKTHSSRRHRWLTIPHWNYAEKKRIDPLRATPIAPLLIEIKRNYAALSNFQLSLQTTLPKVIECRELCETVHGVLTTAWLKENCTWMTIKEIQSMIDKLKKIGWKKKIKDIITLMTKAKRASKLFISSLNEVRPGVKKWGHWSRGQSDKCCWGHLATAFNCLITLMESADSAHSPTDY